MILLTITLTEHTVDNIYTCDGCNMYGTGTRLTCTPCDFNLHDYCAKCPPSLPYTETHPHPMSLVVYQPQHNETKPCQICQSPVQGFAYMCQDYDFWIHPLCVLHYLGLKFFMHPSHQLTELTEDKAYICDGCKIQGTGTRFSCPPCDFVLHEFCAECPTWLPSTGIHPHPMSLFVDKHQVNKTELCEICRNDIQGLAYECKGCNFWVHPLCFLHSLGLGDGGESMIDNQGQSYVQQDVNGSWSMQTTETRGLSFVAIQDLSSRIGLGVKFKNWMFDKFSESRNGAHSFSGYTGGHQRRRDSLHELIGNTQSFFARAKLHRRHFRH